MRFSSRDLAENQAFYEDHYGLDHAVTRYHRDTLIRELVAEKAESDERLTRLADAGNSRRGS